MIIARKWRDDLICQSSLHRVFISVSSQSEKVHYILRRVQSSLMAR